MAQQNWRAVILTQSNRLEVVEFTSPNNTRQDAVAQCMMMYAAKEIKSIHPAATSGSSSNSNHREFSQHIEPSWTLIGFLLLVCLVISFWPYILAAAGIFGIYKLIKYLQSENV
jgi:hypothetical protein